ncbi:MAG: hypothetical protein P8Q14_01185 [Vicingaceae bacterium]|nr:hypothetical protein [Vicingaceae bacterium]
MALVISLLLLLGFTGFGQIHSKHDEKSLLNEAEYKLLDTIFQKKRKTFSFNKKKVAFIQGHSFTDVVTKSEFFKRHIYSHIEKGIKFNILYMILTENQKKDSGGFDVIIYQTPKIMKKNQLKTNLGKLKSNSLSNN